MTIHTEHAADGWYAWVEGETFRQGPFFSSDQARQAALKREEAKRRVYEPITTCKNLEQGEAS